jgi:hypothetical protein
MEGIVVLHKSIHEIHHKKLSGVRFTIDFEKAYDKVEGFRSIVNQKNSYGCEQESQDQI